MTDPKPGSAGSTAREDEPPAAPLTPEEQAREQASAQQRKQAGYLTLLGTLGGIAVLPYMFVLQADKIAETIQKAGASLPGIVTVMVAQTAIQVLLGTLLGLWAARKVGLTAPVTQALSEGQPAWPVIRRFALAAVVWGTALGVLTCVLDALVFVPRLPVLQQLGRDALAKHSVWRAALSCFYGAFTEEILMRLFLLSLTAVGLQALLPKASRDAMPRQVILLGAALVAAVMFGIGHLPAMSALTKLTPLLVGRTVAVNGLAGLGFGFLFTRYGLEAAMLAHLCTDGILHLVVPALYQAGLLSA
jgi:hypothetical protein